MKTLPIVARALACASLAALLVGCQTATQSDLAAAVPHDYRQRHPIAVREGKRAGDDGKCLHGVLVASVNRE